MRYNIDDPWHGSVIATDDVMGGATGAEFAYNLLSDG